MEEHSSFYSRRTRGYLLVTGAKDTSIIATGLTFQHLLENINLCLSVIAGVFTVIYAGITVIYAMKRLQEYLEQTKGLNKKPKKKKGAKK